MPGLISTSDKESTAYWYKVEFIRKRYELALGKEIKRIMRMQRKGINNLADNGTLSSPTVQSIINDTAPRMSQVIEYGATQASKAIEALDNERSASWKIRDANATIKQPSEEYKSYKMLLSAWLRTFSSTEVQMINDATMREIQSILSNNSEAGGTIKDAAKLIDRLYLDRIIPNRSYVIASTEIATGVNGTAQVIMQSSKLEVDKMWVTARDSVVRDTHQMMEGVKVGPSEFFRVPSKSGYDLMQYPAAITASAENRINCRCTQVYVKK